MTRINKSLEDPFLVHVQEIAFSPKSRLPERIFSRKDLHGKFTE